MQFKWIIDSPLLSVRLIAECPWTQWGIIPYKPFYNSDLSTNSEWPSLQSVQLLWFYFKALEAAAWNLIEKRKGLLEVISRHTSCPGPPAGVSSIPSWKIPGPLLGNLPWEQLGHEWPLLLRVMRPTWTPWTQNSLLSWGPGLCAEQGLANYGPKAKFTPMPGFYSLRPKNGFHVFK